MPQLDKRFRNLQILKTTLAFVIMGAVVVGVISTGTSHWFCVSVAAGLPVVVTMALWVKRDFENYHCPRCRLKLGRKHEAPITYYCPTCDIEWDTGSRPSND